MLALLAWLGCLIPAQAEPAARAKLSSALYLRSDTNATTVWSPRTALDARVSDEVSLQAVYAVDAWTSASVDIVTAATAPVHEVRHELNGSAAYAAGDFSLSGSYRYSTENDYWSHGGVLQAALDLAQRNTTLALSLFGSRDRVGHALDQGFHERQATLGGRLSWTQVLDKSMWAQLGWETLVIAGYQASPYRYVAIGGSGTCKSRAETCRPEDVPDQRIRNALLAQLRRALSPRTSLGISYRFYFDSWQVHSHTVAPSFSWLVVDDGNLTLGYRYYTQGEADFYRPRYVRETQSVGYVTRDKELSALYSHRLSLEYTHGFSLSAGQWRMNAGARVSGTRFRYLAFVGLSRVDALEATLLLELAYR